MFRTARKHLSGEYFSRSPTGDSVEFNVSKALHKKYKKKPTKPTIHPRKRKTKPTERSHLAEI